MPFPWSLWGWDQGLGEIFDLENALTGTTEHAFFKGPYLLGEKLYCILQDNMSVQPKLETNT